jgi:hypothetical protein
MSRIPTTTIAQPVAAGSPVPGSGTISIARTRLSPATMAQMPCRMMTTATIVSPIGRAGRTLMLPPSRWSRTSIRPLFQRPGDAAAAGGPDRTKRAPASLREIGRC